MLTLACPQARRRTTTQMELLYADSEGVADAGGSGEACLPSPQGQEQGLRADGRGSSLSPREKELPSPTGLTAKTGL